MQNLISWIASQTFYTWVGLLAGVPTLMAYVRLGRILSKPSSTVRPNLASWLPWLAVDASVLFASLEMKVVTTMAVFGVFTLGTLVIIAIVIYRKAMMKFGIVDGASLVVSAIAFAAWKLTGDARLAIYINVVVVVVATMPTIINAWQDPKTNDLLVWAYFLAGGFINLFAVTKWDMLNGLVLISIVVVQTALVIATAKPYFVRRLAERRERRLASLTARLEGVRDRIKMIRGEVVQLEEYARFKTDTAIDHGSIHWAKRNNARWQEVQHDRQLLAGLIEEEAQLEKELVAIRS